MNLQTNEIKSRHDFYKAFDDEDDLPNLEKITLISSLDSEDEEEEKLNTVSGYSTLLDELGDIYRLFQDKDMKEVQDKDMKEVRDMFSSKVMQPTIEKLHADFEKDFKNLPKDDPIRLKCLELLAYFGIPITRATHQDLS
jgi:hypothetical protein